VTTTGCGTCFFDSLDGTTRYDRRGSVVVPDDECTTVEEHRRREQRGLDGRETAGQ
jgi:hypothetical protein